MTAPEIQRLRADIEMHRDTAATLIRVNSWHQDRLRECLERLKDAQSKCKHAFQKGECSICGALR